MSLSAAICDPPPRLTISIKNRPRMTAEPKGDINVVIAQTSYDRVDVAESLMVNAEVRDRCVITRMQRARLGHGMTESHGRADAFVACVHLEKFDDYDVWCEGRHYSCGPLEAGTVHINDMRQRWHADIRGAFHVVNFYLPQAALNEFTEEYGTAQIQEIECPMNLRRLDPVLTNLAQSLLPTLARPDQTNRLYADHTLRAVVSHVATTYGACRLLRYARGGLAPWQERRVKELLNADLSDNLSLYDLANACGLSSGHFSRAFKQSLGSSPHQWLLAQRIERSKQLLLNTGDAICEIALATGFADQTHFTRVFSQRVGVSPAKWRRAQRS